MSIRGAQPVAPGECTGVRSTRTDGRANEVPARTRWLLRGSFFLCAGLLAALAWLTFAFARLTAGYGATLTALQVFGAGDDLDTVRAERLRLPFGLGRFVALECDPATRTARATAFGLVTREARWSDALGAVRRADSVPALPELELPELPPLSPGLPWPRGGSGELGTLSAELRAELERAVASAFVAQDGAHLATHAVVVVHGGALVAERYAAGIEPDQPLLGWSMTKSVTALLLGRLIALGRVPSEPAPVLAPEWSDPGDPRRAITWEHLLRMTSGLVFLADYERPWSDSLRMLFAAPDAAAFAAEKPLRHAPGVHWSYSDGSSNLLARWIQEHAGATLAEQLAFPARELFGPLGMRTATLTVDPRGHWVGSSLMQASARDWARLGQLVAADGVWSLERLLPAGWVDFLARATEISDQRAYGAHLWRYDPEHLRDSDGRPVPPVLTGVVSFAGHDQQHVWIDRARGLVIVRLGLHEERFDPSAFAARIAALAWSP